MMMTTQLPVLALGVGLFFLITGILALTGPPWQLKQEELNWRRLYSIVTLGAGCLLFAIGLSNLVIRIEPTVASVDLDGSTLVNVLEDRLPPTALSSQRHRELIEAISGAQPRELIKHVDQISPVNKRLGWALLTGGLIFLVPAPFVAWSSRGSSIAAYQKALRVGTLLGTGSLLSLGGVTLLKDLSLQVSYEIAPVERTSAGEALSTVPHGLVGPFATGEASRLETSSGNSSSSVIQSIVDTAEDKDLMLLFIVGSADKRPLSGRLAAAYDSNVGLAQARAEWVREQLRSAVGGALDDKKIIVTTRGPSHTGASIPLDLLSHDRYVAVYGLWLEDRKSGSLGSPRH